MLLSRKAEDSNNTLFINNGFLMSVGTSTVITKQVAHVPKSSWKMESTSFCNGNLLLVSYSLSCCNQHRAGMEALCFAILALLLQAYGKGETPGS